MKIFYSDTFELPLPAGHRFPIEKYRLLREHLQQSDLQDQIEFCLPESATDEQLSLVQTPTYLDKLTHGTLSQVEQRT